ncbi:MAG TPA: hypothetical protein VGY99_04610 [Candidatus Binataceae bacterium]|jgi:hypothetical protein|nr:hypothetical protein [Candidatus Binataceae bacterium]
MSQRTILIDIFSVALSRSGVAIVMLALVAAMQASPALAATPTPTKKPTPTPTPTPRALWMENAHSQNVHEFKGVILTKLGASVPNPSLTNDSPDFRSPLGGDTAGINFDSSNNQWVTNCAGNTSNNGNITEFKLATLKALTTNKEPAANVVISDNGSGKLVNCPWEVTFKSGNLWVANSNQNVNPPVPGFVTEYLPSQIVSRSSYSPYHADRPDRIHVTNRCDL